MEKGNQTILPLFGGTGSTWREANSQWFKSDPSLRWFLRRHQDTLIESGALIRIADRLYAVEPNMTRAVLQIGQREARRAVEGETP